MFYTYVLKSKKNGAYYIGYAHDIKERVSLHNANLISATKRRGPWDLFYYEEFKYEEDAILREQQLKSWKSS